MHCDASIFNYYTYSLFLLLLQNRSSSCRPPPVHPAWRSATRLTCSASWSHGTIPAFLLRSHGASSQQRAMESSEIWWRLRGMAPCSGATSSWAWALAPRWIARPRTPTSASASPEPDARRPGRTSVLPCFIGAITMAPGARWPTAPPTRWASVYCSLVSLKPASVAGKVHVGYLTARLSVRTNCDCSDGTELQISPWHPLKFGFVISESLPSRVS